MDTKKPVDFLIEYKIWYSTLNYKQRLKLFLKNFVIYDSAFEYFLINYDCINRGVSRKWQNSTNE